MIFLQWPDNVKLSDIEVASDLNQLGTKQLKYLLLANRVDFKGCVERYELMDRVLRLWTEYQQSRKGFFTFDFSLKNYFDLISKFD